MLFLDFVEKFGISIGKQGFRLFFYRWFGWRGNDLSGSDDLEGE
jgi:hypothetical protein